MITHPRIPDAAAPRQGENTSLLDRSLLASLNWESLLYALFVVLAVVTRLWDLGARVMSHDESLHTFYSWNLAIGKGFQHTPLMHGPFLFHITALSYFLFGDSDFTARLPMAVFGIGLVAVPFLFRRELGRVGALVASFALLISPSILYHARYIRQEGTILMWTILSVIFVWRYLETKKLSWLLALSAVLAFHATDKATSFLTVAMFMVFLGFIALIQLAYSKDAAGNVATAVKFVLLLAVVLVGLSVAMEILTAALVSILDLKSVVSQTNPTVLLQFDPKTAIFGLVIVVVGGSAAGGLAWMLRRQFGNWVRQVGQEAPAFDVLVTLVTTTLFVGSAAMLLVINPLFRTVRGSPVLDVNLLGEVTQLSFNAQALTTMFALTVALAAVSVGIGIAWGWRRYAAVAGIFIGITLPLFTTLFTNLAGIGSGFVGQLGYWMAQQDVQRGTQPWYYYLILVPMYEYLVLIGAIGGTLFVLAGRGLHREEIPEPDSDAIKSRRPQVMTFGPLEIDVSDFGRGLDFRQWLSPSRSLQLFLVWWAVSTFAIYTIAGEKMPWLTVHIALPMALLTGFFINELIVSGASSWRTLSASRIAAAGILAIGAVIACVRILSVLGSLDIPPANNLQPIIKALTDAGMAIGALVLVLYGIRRLAPGLGPRLFALGVFGFLAALTIRTAITVTYINYDYTREYLFYAHGAPGVKIAVNQLEDISKRLNNGNGIKVGYDSKVSWPLTWYMRGSQFPNARFQGDDFPADFMTYDAFLYGTDAPKRAEIDAKLKDNFIRFDYAYVWWPVEDYKDMTWERLSYSLFNPRARAALWEIIFNRNYEPYAKLFNKTSLQPDNWSPSGRFGLYIRNDIAAQIWQLRMGGVASGETRGESLRPKDPVPQALQVGAQLPGALAVSPKGDRYFADRRNGRVVVLDGAGNIKATWGRSGSDNGEFNEPWGIAIDREGFVWVADTFNHRIQKFDRDGSFLFSVGGGGVSIEPGTGRNTAFFGPRDIAISDDGRVYVSDTGNKRIQIFDSEGNFLQQIGGAGNANGQFSEPVGIDLDRNGNLYVADVWNRRIQVFDRNLNFVRAFAVDAWVKMKPEELQSVDHKAYLAISGSVLFLTSPRSHQVLAYTLLGAPLELPGVSLADADRPTGIAVANGRLFVGNSNGGTILEFPLDAKMQ